MLRNLLRERRRARAVHKLIEHDPAGGQVFNRFVNAAASAFGAPMAALSLIHGTEQLIKAGYGIPITCMSRRDSFCGIALDCSEALECIDPLSDPRFSKLPGVIGEPRARYYIGVPLTLLNGINVGVLCVVDAAARQPASGDQKAYLVGLARQAATTLESRLDLWGHTA